VNSFRTIPTSCHKVTQSKNKKEVESDTTKWIWIMKHETGYINSRMGKQQWNFFFQYNNKDKMVI